MSRRKMSNMYNQKKKKNIAWVRNIMSSNTTHILKISIFDV